MVSCTQSKACHSLLNKPSKQNIPPATSPSPVTYINLLHVQELQFQALTLALPTTLWVLRLPSGKAAQTAMLHVKSHLGRVHLLLEAVHTINFRSGVH